MSDRSIRILKWGCAALAVMLVWQLSRGLGGADPLHNVALPAPAKPYQAPANAPNASAAAGPARPGQPAASASVSPETQARIDRIKDSEIFGPVPRPLPMALLGIAGPDVFLRAPNGQTGLLREGGELGGVKLLRAGTNRVLIELNGQKQELTIFSGFGSETLLQPSKH